MRADKQPDAGPGETLTQLGPVDEARRGGHLDRAGAPRHQRSFEKEREIRVLVQHSPEKRFLIRGIVRKATAPLEETTDHLTYAVTDGFRETRAHDPDGFGGEHLDCGHTGRSPSWTR